MLDLQPTDLTESQIKVWLLETTIFFNFFSSLSSIFKIGKAVQETKSASAFF